MEVLGDVFTTLIETPLANLLIIGGLFFLLLSVVTRIGALLVVSPAKQAQAAVVGVVLLVSGGTLNWLDRGDGPPRDPRPTQELTRRYVTEHAWTFMHGEGDVISAHVELLPSGVIEGIDHPNESRWSLEDGRLVFLHADGQPSTRFDEIAWEDGRAVLSGRLLLAPADDAVIHVLVAQD